MHQSSAIKSLLLACPRFQEHEEEASMLSNSQPFAPFVCVGCSQSLIRDGILLLESFRQLDLRTYSRRSFLTPHRKSGLI
mmetsp:Transcript_18925/g.43528  ORF Transcript_18925/g.43528 Transcript_18925/m.43528 type:complete len:80 (+) Transcript_18925:159-398(+)